MLKVEIRSPEDLHKFQCKMVSTISQHAGAVIESRRELVENLRETADCIEDIFNQFAQQGLRRGTFPLNEAFIKEVREYANQGNPDPKEATELATKLQRAAREFGIWLDE